MAGNAMMRQLAFSKLDLFLHRTLAIKEFNDLEEEINSTLVEYLPKKNLLLVRLCIGLVIYLVVQ